MKTIFKKNLLFFIITIFLSTTFLFQFSFLDNLLAQEDQEITYSGIQLPLDNAEKGVLSFSASHPGVDYLIYDQNGIAKSGDPVHAIANGEVIKKNYNSVGYGNYVVIKHIINGAEVYSLYAHLLNLGEIPNEGTRVSKGAIIGHVGATGEGANNTPHLHFELRTKDAFVNENGEDIWLNYLAEAQELSINLNKYFYEPDSFIKLQQEIDNISLDLEPSLEQTQGATQTGSNFFTVVGDWFKNLWNNVTNIFTAQAAEPSTTKSVTIAASQESQQSITASIESAKVATETTAPIPPPSKPSLTSPYNWYQSIGESPTLRWQGDSNSISYYVLINSSNTGNVVSGWINSTSWKPNLPNQNYIYTWKVKAKNSQSVESPWSDESHFSIASTSLKFEGDISFSPPSPSSADQIKIFASTTGWGGVGITLRVSVNTAPDGSTNGEWKILKELGVPKFNENDAPEWNTQGWSNGTYRIRVEAKGPNDPFWQNPAVIETTYTLVNKPIETKQSYEESNIDIDLSSLLLNEDFSSGNLNFWNTVGDVTIYSDGGNLVAKCISTDQQYTDMYYHFYIQSSSNQQIMINSLKTVNFSCRIKAVDFSSGTINVSGAFISETGEVVGSFDGKNFFPGELPIGSWKTLTFKENLAGYPDFDLIIIGATSSSLAKTIVYFDDFRIY